LAGGIKSKNKKDESDEFLGIFQATDESKPNTRRLTLSAKPWTIAKVLLVVGLMVGAFFFGACATVPTAYQQGYEEGVTTTLEEVRAKLATADIDFDWMDLGNGQYTLTIKTASTGNQLVSLTAQVDCLIQHCRDGELIAESRGAGTLTTWGKNWIEQQISGTLNTTQSALHLGDSNDASAPSAAWTELPSEITTNGLERALGSYVSTGDGTWNVTKTKSVTGTQSTQLWGLYASTIAGTGKDTLIAADSTPDQKNCVSGDTLTETWQISVS
jgi:hypothetical protein